MSCGGDSFGDPSTWGDTFFALEWAFRDQNGDLVPWDSGTIRILDSDGNVLVDAADCIVAGDDDEYLTYTPAFGDDADEVPTISELTAYQVQFFGVATAGGAIHSPVLRWRVKPAL